MKYNINIFLKSNLLIFCVAIAEYSLAMENNEEAPLGCFTFPQNTIINYGQEKSIDLSGLTVKLGDMDVGGIGRCADASQLMASGMKALGCQNSAYNIPFSVHAAIYDTFDEKSVISIEGKKVNADHITNRIKKGIEEGFIYFNIPIDMNNHASLATFVIKENNAELRFYDSLSDQLNPYKERYKQSLCVFVKNLLPAGIQPPKDHKVLHLLDQGGENSTGCGYYSIYTALLMKDKLGFRSIEETGEILFDGINEKHDQRIKALLAIITMLEYGVENIDNRLKETRFTTSIKNIKNIFEKLGSSSVRELKTSLQNRIEKDKNVSK